MPELETVEIHSLTDPSQMWRINLKDFDPSKHMRWSNNAEAKEVLAEAEIEAEKQEEIETDFIYEDGAVESLFVVDPNDKRRRIEISIQDYNPDLHTLWSER